jgi:Uma2 family endonuclease
MGATTTVEELVGVVSDGYPREVAKCNVNRVLTAWSLQRPAFRVLCDAVFQLGEQNCLVPDVSVIASARITPGSTGLLQGAPKVAIEIVSSELATSLQGKIHLYFSNGGKSFWTVYPEERLIRVENALGEGTRFDFDLPLVDPSVLPGFSVPTSAIFEGV